MNVYGGSQIEYNVEVDPNRLEAYGLTLSQIMAQVASRNVQSTGGEITQRGMDYQIMTDARYFTLEDIRETIVGYTTLGTPILLQDVAEVERSNERGGRLNYIDGNEVVTLSISNESDSNETTVAKNIREELPNIISELPEGLTLSIQRDSTEMISDTMDEVFTPSLFLLSKDEMTRLDLRSNPINTWTAPRLSSLLQTEASRSEVYFFDEEENFLRFVKENDCVEILFDEENQEDSSLFYADFYQKAQKRSQKTAVLDYDEGMEEALAHFGLSGYEATIKAGNEKAPLEEGASLLN